jgi:hypothetical protein
MNDSTFIWPRRDPIIGSLEGKIHNPPTEEISAVRRGGEKKLFLIIVNVLGHPKEVGGLTSYFLCGGGMDVFWNDQFVAGIPQSAKTRNSHTSTLSSLPGGCIPSIYETHHPVLPSQVSQQGWIKTSCSAML